MQLVKRRVGSINHAKDEAVEYLGTWVLGYLERLNAVCSIEYRNEIWWTQFNIPGFVTFPWRSGRVCGVNTGGGVYWMVQWWVLLRSSVLR